MTSVGAAQIEERIAALVESRNELLSVLTEVVGHFGPWHDDDCPADDTCDCSARPIHDRVNAAIKNAERR